MTTPLRTTTGRRPICPHVCGAGGSVAVDAVGPQGQLLRPAAVRTCICLRPSSTRPGITQRYLRSAPARSAVWGSNLPHGPAARSGIAKAPAIPIAHRRDLRRSSDHVLSGATGDASQASMTTCPPRLVRHRIRRLPPGAHLPLTLASRGRCKGTAAATASLTNEYDHATEEQHRSAI